MGNTAKGGNYVCNEELY